MLTNKQAYLICQSVSDAMICVEEEVWDHNGHKVASAYLSDLHLISICLLQIEYVAKELGIPEARMFLYVGLHEVGHSQNYPCEQKTPQEIYQEEERAWNNADNLMRKLKLPITKEYKRVKAYALNSHKENLFS